MGGLMNEALTGITEALGQIDLKRKREESDPRESQMPEPKRQRCWENDDLNSLLPIQPSIEVEDHELAAGSITRSVNNALVGLGRPSLRK